MTKSGKKSNRIGSSIFGIILAIMMLGLAVAAGFYMEKNTYIHAVQITGNHFVDSDEIQSVIFSPVGMRADSVNFDSLFNQIKMNPYINDVTVSMSIRGTLTFQVQEHTPMAMLVNGSSRTYIAPGGVELPVIRGKAVNVPLVYGVNMSGNTDSTFTNEYRLMEDFLIALLENQTGWATISEISWSNREGIVALTIENGVKLIFGEENYFQKLQDWQAFYAEAVTQKGLQSFEIIDLRFRDQIITRKS